MNSVVGHILHAVVICIVKELRWLKDAIIEYAEQKVADGLIKRRQRIHNTKHGIN